MKKKVILSLFDGLSCGNIAIDMLLNNNKLTKDLFEYVASEVDEEAMKVAKHNYPNIRHIGDVRHITKEMVGEVYLLIAGSPCTDLSVAGKKNGMVTEDDIKITSLEQYLKLKSEGYVFKGQSYLFWEFVRLLKELKPKYFLLENVTLKGQLKEWEEIITRETGVKPLRINSNKVSAQNRDRLYWTNIPGACVPEDENILASDVIPGAVAGYGKRGVKNKITGKYEYPGTTRKDGKFNCLTTVRGNCAKYKTLDGEIKNLTIPQMEMLQTFPIGYTNVDGVSQQARTKMIGNSWTAKVIAHLFKGLEKDLVK
jgi:DNA (cytosine-5)-methyltransferase 3A